MRPVFRLSFLLATSSLHLWCIEPSPAGLWKTFDDSTHKPRGAIRIFEENGKWYGRIESTFDPAEQNEICDRCSGDRKNQRVIGMVIMRGLTRHGSDYSGGDILDPETGLVYSCRFTLTDHGRKLLVRGYFGLSILGRSQIWTREPEP